MPQTIISGQTLFSGGSLLLAACIAGVLTYVFTFGVIALCRKLGWVEPVQEGKIHTVPRPRIGGLAIFCAFLLVSLVLYAPSLGSANGQVQVIFGRTFPKELVIYVLFILASVLIVAVHVYDDIKGLKPLPKLLAQTLAVLILLGPGLHSFHGILFFGVNNPFASGVPSDTALPWYQRSVLTLLIQSPEISWLAIPAVLFTWFWFAGMMNAVNFIDGLDGLATGIVAIAGLFITIISWIMGQQSIALLSAIFTGAVVGFLPHNWKPARIIMGDSGSQFLGIALAALAIVGGAKFALILMVLGIPILDIAQVVVNRVLRGRHPMQRDLLPQESRYSHLHYRLLFGGLSARQVCYILYTVTLGMGLLALVLHGVYKLLGFAVVGIVMSALLVWSTRLQARRLAQASESLGEPQS